MDKRLKENILFTLGVILIYFFDAWDFISYYDNPYKLDLLSSTYLTTENVKYFEKIRIFTYFLKYILKIGYWGFFIFLVLFVISFVYVCEKLEVKRIFVYLSLLTLPTLRYGVWDYGVNASDGFIYLIMIWTYYFYRTNQNKKYYLLSLIGFFTREFCIYVNLFFIIESYCEDCKIKDLGKRTEELKHVFQKRTFEILLVTAYIIYRSYFMIINRDERSLTSFGSFQELGKLTNPKYLFVTGTMFSFIGYYILKQKKAKYWLLLIAVFIPSFLIGLIWEINKIGCIFVIYVPEFFKKVNKPHPKNAIKHKPTKVSV